MDLLIPAGTRLFHGTLVEFPAAKLTTGGYDDVLWTTDNACIAQSYLSCSGISTTMGPGSMVWPSQDRHVQAVQARLGFDFGYGEPRGPVFDERGRPSWHWPEGMPKERWEAEQEIKRRILAAGWKPIRAGSEVFEFDFSDGELLDAGKCAEGRLFILTVEQPLRIFDMTEGGELEGDLMDVDYHKLDVFRAAEARGYDGIKINDYAQSKLWGNFGHTSVGIFRGSLGKLSWTAIPAQNFDWPDYETLQRGLTPELEAWLADQAMARRNPRKRRNSDAEIRALERRVLSGSGDDEERQRLCLWWERTRLGLPIRKPEPQPHPVQDSSAAGGWSQILQINARWHLKDAWEKSSNGVLESGDIEEEEHELLRDAAPELEEVRRLTFLEKPEYETHADLTGEDWWNYLVKVEGSVPSPDDEDEENS